jgi:hypothetical protein
MVILLPRNYRVDILQADFSAVRTYSSRSRSDPYLIERSLCRRAASHKTVINDIALISPGRYLIKDKLFRKDRGVLECDLVLRRRRSNIVKEDVVDLTFLRRDMIVSKVIASDLCNSKRFERLLLFYRRIIGLKIAGWRCTRSKTYIQNTAGNALPNRAGSGYFGIDHRVVNESDLLTARSCRKLVSVSSPFSVLSPTTQITTPAAASLIQRRNDLLDREMMAV